jgi:UPF0716 protein FxsA
VLFLALLIVVPIVEIYVIILVGQAIGGLETVGLLILLSLAGIYLTKYAGFKVLRSLRAQLEAGRTPANELIDGVLVLCAGVLLVVPGFVTGAIGLLLLFPPSRSVVRGYLRRRFELRVVRGGGPGRGGISRGDGVIDI